MNISKPTFLDGYDYVKRQVQLGWKQNSGRILTFAGTAGLVYSGVHACRKTYKHHDELKANGAYITSEGELREGDKRFSATKRKAHAFIKSAAKSSRLYAADAVIGGLSAYAVAKGWHQEHKLYKEATAMVGVVMADFLNYRNNVIAEHGKEADRRYMTKRRGTYISEDPEKGQTVEPASGEEHILELSENSLRIRYSKETTPGVWSESLILRKAHLDDITSRLTMDLIYGGSYTVNDVRRYFYGRKGDVGEGGLYGRIWDPGDPEHPERGALPNLHYEDDEDFMSGRTDSCWIIIDIDNEPLFELMKKRRDRSLANDIIQL